MSFASRAEQAALVAAIDNNDVVEILRFSGTTERAKQIRELVTCLRIIQDDARAKNRPVPTMRSFLTSMHGWDVSTDEASSPLPDDAPVLARADAQTAAIYIGGSMPRRPYDATAASTTAPTVSAAPPASTSAVSAQTESLLPPRTASVGSSDSPKAAPLSRKRRLDSGPPPEPASPQAEIDPVRGRRLGTTNWYSNDFVTPAQLPEIWAQLEPVPRINMVVKVLKNRTPRKKTDLDYRTVLVDTGDGTESIVRATKDSTLWLESGWQSVLEPGTLVVLMWLEPIWDKDKVAIQFGPNSWYRRIAEGRQASWAWVQEWHRWMDDKRETRRLASTIKQEE